jgi:succinate dehydrogenase / fumarate reductase membrane anchor subunit
MGKQWMQKLLRRALGLRAARTGVEHWWIQRMTAVALVPLTLWFVASLITSSGGDYNAVTAWLGAPFVTIFVVLLLIMLFQHMALGLQVVIEDYVHSDEVKVPTLVAIHCVCFGLAVAGIIATLYIAFDR